MLLSQCGAYHVAPEAILAMKKLIFLVLLVSSINSLAAKQYSYFRLGNANDVTTSTTPGTVLMGGGTDVDAAFQWMCQRSGDGDFLVIRASGTEPLLRVMVEAEDGPQAERLAQQIASTVK